jgi:hypothetical protein
VFKRFRVKLAVMVVAVIAGVGAMSGTALAAGVWSPAQPVDTAGASLAGSYLIACPSSTVCIGASGSTDGPVAFQGPPDTAFAFSLTTPFGSGDNGVELTSLQCPSISLCVGVADYNSDEDDVFDVVASTDPAAGPDSWVPQGLGDFSQPGSFASPAQLSCPTTTFCAGAGPDGIVTSEDPAGGADAWKVDKVGGGGIIEVSCSSADFCAGYDGNGDVWTSTDPGGGPSAWVQSGAGAPLKANAVAYDNGDDDGGSIGTQLPENFTCAGPNLCVATAGSSDTVLVSTDPAGSAAWTSVTADTVPITAIYCEPGTQLCLIGDNYGDTASSQDGGVTWTNYGDADAGGHVIDDVSCVGQTCAVASADSLPPVVLTVPTAGGPPPGGQINVVDHDALTSISCPSQRECIGADQTRYYTSANPSLGLGSWHHAAKTNLPVDAPANTLDTACYSASGCLAVTDNAPNGLADVEGGVLDRFDPQGGAHGFHDTHFGGDNNFLYVTCAQGTCVAGFPGAWHQSSHPALDTGWKRVADPHFDVTCLSGNRSCVALPDGPFPGTAGHDLLVAARRTGPWKRQDIDPDGYISGLACTSAKACVVVNEGGQLLTSTQPTGGPRTWKLADTDLSGFNGVACETARTCVAVDDSGGVVVGHP